MKGKETNPVDSISFHLTPLPIATRTLSESAGFCNSRISFFETTSSSLGRYADVVSLDIRSFTVCTG